MPLKFFLCSASRKERRNALEKFCLPALFGASSNFSVAVTRVIALQVCEAEAFIKQRGREGGGGGGGGGIGEGEGYSSVEKRRGEIGGERVGCRAETDT